MSLIEIVRKVSPMGLMDGFVGFTGFNTLHGVIKEQTQNGHMANNFTALFHAGTAAPIALSYILSGNAKIYYLLQKFCSGYFAYDTFYTIKYRKYNLTSAMFCYHHLASIYYLHQNPTSYMAHQVIFWGELSNLPSYFVYYYLKTNKNPKMLKWLKKLQFCLYSFIRLPIMSYLTYTALSTVEDRRPIYAVLPVYLMGLFWSRSLYKNL